MRRRNDRGVNAELCMPIIVVNAAYADGEHPEQNHPNRSGCDESEDFDTGCVLARPVVSRVDDEVKQGKHYTNGESAEDHQVRWGQHSVPANIQMPLQVGGEADSSNQMVEREEDAKEIDESWPIHRHPPSQLGHPAAFVLDAMGDLTVLGRRPFHKASELLTGKPADEPVNWSPSMRCSVVSGLEVIVVPWCFS